MFARCIVGCGGPMVERWPNVGEVAQWLARWAGDSNVAGSIRGRATLLSVLRQDSLPPRCLVRQMGT